MARDGDKKRKLERLIALILLYMSEHTERLVAGEITLDEWYQAVSSTLVVGHASAASLGRSAAIGKPEQITMADRILAQGIVAGEQQFLTKFREDIATGRYDKQAEANPVEHEESEQPNEPAEPSAMEESVQPVATEETLNGDKIDKRLELYSHKLRSTMLEAFVTDSADGEKFLWILDDCVHCQGNHGLNCPALSEKSPYTKETIPTYPASGTTPCGVNCRCRLLRVSDGYDPIGDTNG